jgi:hypothetical protein
MQQQRVKENLETLHEKRRKKKTKSAEVVLPGIGNGRVEAFVTPSFMPCSRVRNYLSSTPRSCLLP